MSQYKLVLLGETAVGKSSLALRFARNQFLEYQESTIGAAFLTQSVDLDGETIKFEIWDTAGQERYHSLAPMYYRGAKAAVVVYDITSNASFERSKSWVAELQQSGSVSMVIALTGNKADLDDAREVATSDAQQFAKDNGLLFMETSAKGNVNIHELFQMVAKHLPKGPRQSDANTLQLHETTANEKGCAC